MDHEKNKNSQESSRFSLGVIGMIDCDIENEREIQKLREISFIKRGSLIKELSNVSSLYSHQNDAIQHYENKMKELKKKPSCCIIN